MSNHAKAHIVARRTVTVVSLAALGIGGSAVAVAGGLDASPPAVIDADGTHGEFKPAVHGTIDDGGLQDAYLINSVVAVPQTRA